MNTFGLLPGPEGTCPGCTVGEGGCWAKQGDRSTETCYVVKLMQAYPSTGRVLEDNTELLKSSSYNEMVEILVNEFNRFEKSNKRSRSKPKEQLYRLHWSGDIFSQEYARALNTAMYLFPDITFWCYTRSFEFLGEFDVPNLIMFVSTDPVNFMNGFRAYVDYNANPIAIRIAYMGKSLEELPADNKLARISRARHKLNSLFGLNNNNNNTTTTHSQFSTCPTDSGKLSFQDACNRCRMCNTRGSRNNIFFKVR